MTCNFDRKDTMKDSTIDSTSAFFREYYPRDDGVLIEYTPKPNALDFLRDVVDHINVFVVDKSGRLVPDDSSQNIAIEFEMSSRYDGNPWIGFDFQDFVDLLCFLDSGDYRRYRVDENFRFDLMGDVMVVRVRFDGYPKPVEYVLNKAEIEELSRCLWDLLEPIGQEERLSNLKTA